ncbi:MAG: hypothetical protein IJV04_01015 [Lachnospiraceae bacterium]|nr:hypothetical protein [Lachnospiraceae bacterium]
MDAQLKNFFGIEWDEERNAAEPDKSYVKISPGENAIISLNKNASDFGIQSTYSTVTKESGDSASRDVDGRRIRITDVGGFEIDFLIDDRAVKQYNDQEISYTDADGNEVKYTAEEFKRKRASLLEEKAEIEKERNGLEERKANLEKAITDMTTTDEDRAAAQAELKDVEAWLDVIEQAEAGTSVEDQKNSVTGELDSKKTELADLETALEAATDEDEITDLKNQIAAKNAEIEELNTRLAAINKESRLEEIDTEVTNINKALTEASHMPIEMEITDVGPMNLQIGANEGQQMTVRLDSISAENLYLDQIDVTTQRGATRALEQLDEVLSRVTDVRAHIGAYSNRLEHAVASLDQTNENMEQAISRIKDVDMAEEMTEYTKYNVLQQAATSALSQANELPQTALQLLQ